MKPVVVTIMDKVYIHVCTQENCLYFTSYDENVNRCSEYVNAFNCDEVVKNTDL